MASEPKRIMVKAISWESISLVLTFLIAWLIFDELIVCGIFAVISFVVKIVVYYIHEQVWSKVKYGKSHGTTTRRY